MTRENANHMPLAKVNYKKTRKDFKDFLKRHKEPDFFKFTRKESKCS